MKKIWKDVLWLGKWTTPDGRTLTVKRADLDQALENGRKMLADGYSIPWCWDHQADAMPVMMSSTVYKSPNKTADIGRNIITPRTVDFEIRQTKNGPAVFAAFDASKLSAQEVEQVKRAGSVSCRIDRGFWDARGNGKKLDGLSISHVAVTPKPLEPNQGPFLMSSLQCADESYFLGYAAMAKDKDDKGDDYEEFKMDDEPKSEPTEKPSDDDTMASTDLELPPEPSAATPPPVDAAAPASDANVMSIVGSLTAMGIPLPSDGTITDINSLAMALKIAAGLGAKANQGGELTHSNDTATASNPPMLMSQAAMAAKYPDRVENDRKNLKAQIKLLFRQGQITGPTRDAMLADFDSFEMSYQGDRLKVRGLLAAVQNIKKYIPAGTFFRSGKPFDMSQTATVAAPDSLASDPKRTEQEADANQLRQQIELDNKRRGIK